MKTKNCMDYFPERLKDLRKESNLSTTKLGEHIGVSAIAISRWERGIQIPNIDYLYRLAKFFNVSSDYLLGLED